MYIYLTNFFYIGIFFYNFFSYTINTPIKKLKKMENAKFLEKVFIKEKTHFILIQQKILPLIFFDTQKFFLKKLSKICHVPKSGLPNSFYHIYKIIVFAGKITNKNKKIYF